MLEYIGYDRMRRRYRFSLQPVVSNLSQSRMLSKHCIENFAMPLFKIYDYRVLQQTVLELM